MKPNNCDGIIVANQVPRFWLLKFLGGKRLVRVVINRAHECGYIRSDVLHLLHELTNRVFR